MTALLIALGGALGTWLRHLVNMTCSARWGDALPFATLAVNLVGSFFLAFLSQLLSDRTFAGVPLSLILGTGLIGGFTTYSTFNLETLRMIQSGDVARATAYAGTTFAGCLAFGALGFLLGARLVR